MIKYYFLKKNEKIQKIKVQGHSLSASENTNNIVCASVSTAVIMTVNMIEILGSKSKIDFVLKEGYFILKILDFDVTVNKILSNLEYTLEDLSSNYSEYLKKINH
ncbi:ribosomal-processing cysteine protease Prp ['Camptotheca acuminata' phytoplasma]|uniref:ribosomal-processing cysteine protease Prp n=1 Tax='Camptotheca acuminata' phytoplasma TaxID=3239192 RepID=UPI00351A593F